MKQRRYTHVFPVSEFFSELRDCYMSASVRLDWMSVENMTDWGADRPEWSDPGRVIVLWGRLPNTIVPFNRKATLVFRYTESIGDPEKLATVARELMQDFSAKADLPDLLLAGCPAVANYWSRLCRAVAVAPIGYEASVLGAPDWSVKKMYKLAFRGNYIDRRTWIIKKLNSRFGSQFKWIHNFGLERKRQLDTCFASLYVGHSIEQGFPGARLWQDIASSSAILTEPRDAWPAEAGRHYVQLPIADHDKPKIFLDAIDKALESGGLELIARTAHSELSRYTVDHCMLNYVVPAVEDLAR